MSILFCNNNWSVDCKEPFNTWDETKKYLSKLDKNQYSFRGHKCGTWLIESSLERRKRFSLKDNSLDEQLRFLCKYYLNVKFDAGLSHNDILNFFKKLRLFFNTSKDLSNEFSKIYHKIILKIWEMQHHGIPTHLLDITYDFFIAAYFALFNDKKEIIKTENTNEYPAILCFKYKNKIRPKLQEYFKRMKDQKSNFIDTFFSGYFSVILIYLNPNWIKEIYNDLQKRNITGYSLFGTTEKLDLDKYWSQWIMRIRR